jgi:hypothetical protein
MDLAVRLPWTGVSGVLGCAVALVRGMTDAAALAIDHSGNNEAIPRGHRQTIRRYFELIRPKSTDTEPGPE